MNVLVTYRSCPPSGRVEFSRVGREISRSLWQSLMEASQAHSRASAGLISQLAQRAVQRAATASCVEESAEWMAKAIDLGNGAGRVRQKAFDGIRFQLADDLERMAAALRS